MFRAHNLTRIFPKAQLITECSRRAAAWVSDGSSARKLELALDFLKARFISQRVEKVVGFDASWRVPWHGNWSTKTALLRQVHLTEQRVVAWIVVEASKK